MSPPTADVNSDCYYRVLGLDRNASDAEVKKAYRKLALELHPDKNPDDPKKAEEDFKKVAEAYQVLHDKEARKRYDQFGKGVPSQCGPDGNGPNFSSDGMSAAMAEEIFRTFFGPGASFPSAGGLGGMTFMMHSSGGDADHSGTGFPFGRGGGIDLGSAMPNRARSNWHRPGRSSAPQHAIPAGTSVVIQSLAKTPEHNGKMGSVLAWDANSGRYQVEVDGGLVLSLRPQCLLQRCSFEVVGLESKPELNGQCGEIHGYDEARGRYLVLLASPAPQVLSLQPSTCLLPQGTCVRLKNLSKADLNDAMAQVVAVDREAGRYIVQCQDGRRIKVKFENVLC